MVHFYDFKIHSQFDDIDIILILDFELVRHGVC